MFCHMNNIDSTKLTILGLIQIWECALIWFIVKQVHEPKLDIYHLRDLGATYSTHVFADPYV